MNQENYFDILIGGLLEHGEHLASHIYRESLKAQDNHIEPSEFFNRCTKVIVDLTKYIDSQMQVRKREITEIFTYVDRIKDEDIVNNAKEELKSMTRDEYPINLIHLTNGKYTGFLSYYQIQVIITALLDANKKTAPLHKPNKVPKQIKSFPEYIDHPKKEQLAEAIKREFQGKKGIKIRRMIKVLMDHTPRLLINLHREDKDLFLSMKDYFDWHIGSLQSIFDATEEEVIKNKKAMISTKEIIDKCLKSIT